MTESRIAPTTVPVMLPAPPLSAVPPTITAVMTNTIQRRALGSTRTTRSLSDVIRMARTSARANGHSTARNTYSSPAATAKFTRNDVPVLLTWPPRIDRWAMIPRRSITLP